MSTLSSCFSIAFCFLFFYLGLLPLPLTGEVVLLARDAENGVPERSVRVDLLAFADSVFDRNVRECVVHAADDHVGLAGHAGVYGSWKQKMASVPWAGMLRTM